MCRLQDVRATEADKVEIYASFRPGDLVRAEVVALGCTLNPKTHVQAAAHARAHARSGCICTARCLTLEPCHILQP